MVGGDFGTYMNTVRSGNDVSQWVHTSLYALPTKSTSVHEGQTKDVCRENVIFLIPSTTPCLMNQDNLFLRRGGWLCGNCQDMVIQ